MLLELGRGCCQGKEGFNFMAELNHLCGMGSLGVMRSWFPF